MDEQIRLDAEEALHALAAKTALYDLLWSYYDGNQPVRYATERLSRMFESFNVRFTQNWCAVVVDSVLDRLQISRPSFADDAQLSTVMERVWSELELNLTAQAVHLCLLVCGEAFLIVERDDSGSVEAYYNDARLCHMAYDPANPRRERWAAKRWLDSSGQHLILFYPDRTIHLINRKNDSLSALSYAVVEELPNELGFVPVFHFRSDRGRRVARSELVNVMSIQDAVNKLFADMMVAAEYGAFRQRWVISAAGIGNLRNAPNEVWDLPSAEHGMQPTQVGEFGQTDLRVFIEAMDSLAAKLAAITRTPKHYLLMQGGDPSGEALAAMEAPLIAKVLHLHAHLTPVWRQVLDALLTLFGRRDTDYAGIRIEWRDPRTPQPLLRAQERDLSIRAGVPLRTQLRREGWSEADLAQLELDQRSDPMTTEELRLRRAQRLLAETQLGVSQATALSQMGYDPEHERALRETTEADAAERLLTALERRNPTT